MADGEDQSDDQTDSESSPSLSGLSERVTGQGDRSEPTTQDTASSDAEGDNETTTSRTNDDDGFFFPGDDTPDNSTDSDESSPTLEPIEQGLTDTSADGRPDSGQDEPSDGGLGPDAKTKAIIELTRDVQNLALMGPPHSPADYELCANLTMPQSDPPDHLLLLTFEKSPDERLNILQGHLKALPDSIAMLNIGEATRSGSSDTPSVAGTDEISVDNISDQTDVQRMGLTINKYLSEWEGDGEIVLCFHSLTALLDAVDSETVFRFLNVLLGRVRSGDVRAHYHIDPDAVEDHTLETYRPLFDEQLVVEEDGSVSIDR